MFGWMKKQGLPRQEKQTNEKVERSIESWDAANLPLPKIYGGSCAHKFSNPEYKPVFEVLKDWGKYRLVLDRSDDFDEYVIEKINLDRYGNASYKDEFSVFTTIDHGCRSTWHDSAGRFVKFLAEIAEEERDKS